MKLEKYKEKNPKKTGIILFTIACILLIAEVFFYISFASFESKETYNIMEGSVSDPGDIYFAYYVDGVATNTLPSKEDGYIIDSTKTNCTKGAKIVFDSVNWEVIISELTESMTKCTLYFKKVEIPTDTFAATLLAQGETDELKLDGTVDNNLRYVGVNPNNYVKFDGKLWRIVGVFNNVLNENNETQSRIKLVREDLYIDYTAWDVLDINEWQTASLQTELNTNFYNQIDSLHPYIASAYWNIGDSSTYKDVTTAQFYEAEKKEIWLGNVGLINVSDVGFATYNGDEEVRNGCLENYLYEWSENRECYDQDWLFFERTYWTINNCSMSDYYAFTISTSGRTNINHAKDEINAVYPTVFLKEDVKVLSGTGTLGDPYILTI